MKATDRNNGVLEKYLAPSMQYYTTLVRKIVTLKSSNNTLILFAEMKMKNLNPPKLTLNAINSVLVLNSEQVLSSMNHRSVLTAV